MSEEESHPPSSSKRKLRSLFGGINWMQLLLHVLITVTVAGLMLYCAFTNMNTQQAIMVSSENDHKLMEEIQQLKSNMMTELKELRAAHEVQEVRLEEARAMISRLEEVITALNTSKAAKATVDELANNQKQLEYEKVDKTEFENLSDNVTLLRETTSAADEEIHRELTESVAELEVTKVDKTEFEVLSDNVTLLREATSAADKNIRQELGERIKELETKKVDKREFEILSGDVTSLEEASTQADKEIKELMRTGLDSISADVQSLTKATNKHRDRLDDMEQTIKEHHSSVQQQLSDISSSTSSMSSDIRQNRYDIGDVKTSFEDLKNNIPEQNNPTLWNVFHNTFG